MVYLFGDGSRGVYVTGNYIGCVQPIGKVVEVKKGRVIVEFGASDHKKQNLKKKRVKENHVIK